MNGTHSSFLNFQQKGVLQISRLYYQHDPERVSCCPLTVHALLHIAPTIRAMGPVWAYWAFSMERYCSDIMRHIRSRRFPYASINKYVTSRAQLTQISLLYNLENDLQLVPRPSHDRDVHLPLCESFAHRPTHKLIAFCIRSIVCPYSACAIFWTHHRFFVEAAHCNAFYSL